MFANIPRCFRLNTHARVLEFFTFVKLMAKRVANCLNGLELGDFRSEDQQGLLEVLEEFFTAASDSDDSDDEFTHKDITG